MLFVVLFLCVIALANRYLWLRLVRDTRLARPAHYAATALIIMLAGSLPVLVLIWSAWSRSYAPLVNFVAFSWLGVSFYLVTLLLASDAVRALWWLWQHRARAATLRTRRDRGRRRGRTSRRCGRPRPSVP